MGAVKWRRLASLAAIYSLIFLSNGTLLLSPAMDTMVNNFVHEPYSKVLMIYTLPSLVALPFTLMSALVMGKRVPYRTALLTVVPVYLISGVAPFFLKSLNAVLACRAAFGMCIGILAPQGNALILRTFSGEERYRFLGYSSVVIGVAGVVFQFLAGFLCTVGWNYVFLGHLVAVVPLVLILFFLEEPGVPAEEDRPHVETPAPAKGSFLKPGVIPLFGLVCILYICSQTKMLTLSSIVASEGMGDSVVSAGILSMATVGAILGGLIFPYFCKYVTRYRTAILILVLSLTTLCNLINSPVVIGVGYAIGTMAFMMNLSLVTVRASRLFPATESSKATTVIQFADKGGVFLSTYYTTAIKWMAETFHWPISVYKAPVAVCVVVYALAALYDKKKYGPDVS